MITVIIWSKDRACQTELMIRSMKEKFHVDKRIYLQYTTTSQAFEEGFQKLRDTHKDITYRKEESFKETLCSILDEVKTEYVVFFTDDDVFLQDLNGSIAYPNEYHCLSLRMNPTIDRCYPAGNKFMSIPCCREIGEHILWNWKEVPDQHTCWGYPMAINSHIYRSKDIIPLIQSGSYHNVNSLEAHLNRNRWHDKPYMLSFTETKVFNVQNNFVQGPRQNEQKYSVEWLNEQFLAGKRISSKNIYGLKPQAAHGTIEYVMENE